MYGIGEVFTYRKQEKVNKGYGFYDPTKVFTKESENGKVLVDGVLSSICKSYEADTGTVVIAGKTYKTVKIGNQTWLAENLAMVVGDLGAEGLPTEAACWYYNNDETTSNGILYNGYAALEINVPGWHVPTLEEAQNLLDNYTGKQLKAEDFGGTNESGLNATATGVRNTSGVFQNNTTMIRIWTSKVQPGDTQNFINLQKTSDTANIYNVSQTAGYSIRLVKDVT